MRPASTRTSSARPTSRPPRTTAHRPAPGIAASARRTWGASTRCSPTAPSISSPTRSARRYSATLGTRVTTSPTTPRASEAGSAVVRGAPPPQPGVTTTMAIAYPQIGRAGRDTPSGVPASGPEHRVQVDGRLFARAGQRFRIQGVTYGPFAPNGAGEPFPDAGRVAEDFVLMRGVGINSVRTYHVPPEWLLQMAD